MIAQEELFDQLNYHKHTEQPCGQVEKIDSRQSSEPISDMYRGVFFILF